jgi:hypothetical protein
MAALGSTVTERISMLPLTHNADSFAYRPERLPEAFSRSNESWGWLLDPLLRARTALQSDAAIGALDAALAVQGAGLARVQGHRQHEHRRDRRARRYPGAQAEGRALRGVLVRR